MPFYQYFCGTCETQFKTYHGPDEKCEACPKCSSPDIKKGLPQLTLGNKVGRESTPGQRVEKFIEESRQNLQQQLEEARKEL